MFLRQEDFATVVRSTPLVSLDFIVENSRGEFLLGKRTNRPAQGYWFVPGGRVQKDETLEAAFERLTMAELGLRLPITAGQFYGVWHSRQRHWKTRANGRRRQHFSGNDWRWTPAAYGLLTDFRRISGRPDNAARPIR